MGDSLASNSNVASNRTVESNSTPLSTREACSPQFNENSATVETLYEIDPWGRSRDNSASVGQNRHPILEIDFNNVPSWIDEKFKEYFKSTGKRIIGIEEAYGLICCTVSNEDMVDLCNYYSYLIVENSASDVILIKDEGKSSSLSSFVSSVSSNLDQPLNLLGKSVLSASSKALENSSILAEKSERAYNLAYGAYELGGPIMDAPLNRGAELASQSSAMASYGTKLGIVGKVVPLVGPIIGIGVDLHLDRRIGKI